MKIIGDTAWTRCSKSLPCPICHKTDWCCVGVDRDTNSPVKALCGRVEQGHEAVTENGYIHSLSDRDVSWTPPDLAVGTDKKLTVSEVRSICATLRSGMTDARLASQAGALGVTPASLRMLRVGWSKSKKAIAFPMFNSAGNPVGVRYRAPGGRKWAEPRSRQGLFLPCFPNKRRVMFVCEGPTDTAALLGLDLFAIGRPGVFGAWADVCSIAGEYAAKVIVVPDSDAEGSPAATAQAKFIEAVSSVLDVFVMPVPAGFKDVREWVRAGATQDHVTDLAREAMRKDVAA